MNIFISWSGDPSREIAQELKNWIPVVIQSAKPYYTPQDIEPGQRWDAEISKKLSECVIGLICLTKDNTEKPWILFEAGALSNSLDQSRVCPILFGVKKSEVTGPLSGIQLTPFNNTNFFQLIQIINRISETSIEETILKRSFDAFFPQLEEKVKEILEKYENDSPVISEKPERSDRNILEEILDLVRKQNSTNKISKRMHDRISEEILSLAENSDKESAFDTFSIYDKVYSRKHGIGEVFQIKSVDNKMLIGVKFEKDNLVSYYDNPIGVLQKLS